MASPTVQGAESDASPALERGFNEQLKQSISRYMGADRETLDRRLDELDGEWNVERLIEIEAPVTIALGILLGLARSRKWLMVSALAAGMVILHSVRGLYPLLPLFRAMGLRTQNEIEQERIALRMLRGDYESYRPRSIH